MLNWRDKMQIFYIKKKEKSCAIKLLFDIKEKKC